MAALQTNYYLILELDPSEDDWEVIKQQIAKKRREWSTNMTSGHLESQKQARKYSEMISAMETALSDPARRGEIAQEARQQIKGIQHEQERKLDDAIAVLRARGMFRAEDRSLLYTQFEKTLGRKAIDSRLQAAGLSEVKDPGPKPPPPVLDEVVIRGIEQNQALLGIGNLYDFLELPPQSSCEVLRRRADEIYREVNPKPTNTDNDARKALVAAAKTVFKSDDEKQKYDNTLALRRVVEMHSDIDRVGRVGRFINEGALNSLVNVARGRGVDPAIARDYIVDYAKKKGWGVQAGPPPVPLPICPNPKCLTVAETPETRVCKECGTALYINCPFCGTENAAENRYCSNEQCRSNIGDAPLAQRLLAQAQALARQGQMSAAIAKYDEALQIWPRWQVALAEREQTVARQRARDESLIEINRLVDGRRSFKARQLLTSFRESYGNGGLEDLSSRVKRSIELADAEFAKAQELTRQGRVEDAYQSLVIALQHCADHSQALTAMSELPPAPPADLRVRGIAGGFHLQWAAAPTRGDIKYRIIQQYVAIDDKTTRPPVIMEAAATEWDDVGVEPGAVVNYSVWTVRYDALSRQAARSSNLVVAADVSDVEVKAGDKRIDLTWKPVVGCLRVEVWRVAGTSAPASSGDKTPITVVQNAAYDTGLVNGETYAYLIVTVYSDPNAPGRELRSPGIRRTVSPVAPPRAILDLTAVYDRERSVIRLSWRRVEGATLEIRQASRVPMIQPGTIVSAASMREFGPPLPLSSDSSAEIVSPHPGRYIYVPLSVRGSVVVAGAPVAVTVAQEVTQLQGSRQGDGIALRWRWPVQTDEVMVSYAYTKPPTAPGENGSHSITVTRAQYDYDGYWMLAKPEAKTHYFTIFVKVPGSETYSDGSTVAVHIGQTQRIRYELGFDRKFFGKSIQRAWIELVHPSIPRLRDLVVVSKRSGPPLGLSDGERVFEVASVDFQAGRARIELPPHVLNVACFIKVYFKNPEQYPDYGLIPSNSERLEIK